ncbi:hypothetical protein KI387_008387, partial [Taxus chinensis]
YVKSKASTGPQQSAEYDKIDIGSSTDPKLVNIGKCCTADDRKKEIVLLKRYKDVLAYSYEDLKAFKPKDMQHSIPLKP